MPTESEWQVAYEDEDYCILLKPYEDVTCEWKLVSVSSWDPEGNVSGYGHDHDPRPEEADIDAGGSFKWDACSSFWIEDGVATHLCGAESIGSFIAHVALAFSLAAKSIGYKNTENHGGGDISQIWSMMGEVKNAD
jgi:hypothetical protein